MPFCPTCGYEYRTGVDVCPDCGAALVASPPDRDTPLVAVYEAPDEFTSRIVLDMLEAAGIHALEKVERSAAFDGIDLSTRGFYSRVFVFESSAEEAAALIAELIADLNKDDDAPT